MNNRIISNLLLEIYRDLYANCTTPVSFDRLLETSPKDFRGKVIIPHNYYFIDGEIFDEIVEKNLQKVKLTTEERQWLKLKLYLGDGSPTVF